MEKGKVNCDKSGSASSTDAAISSAGNKTSQESASGCSNSNVQQTEIIKCRKRSSIYEYFTLKGDNYHCNYCK